MLLFSFLSSICSINFNFYINKVSLKVRCALLTAVYDKLLQIPMCHLSTFSTGQLINFVSTDIDRIVGFVTSFHAVWSMPMNLIIALFLLYKEVILKEKSKQNIIKNAYLIYLRLVLLFLVVFLLQF